MGNQSPACAKYDPKKNRNKKPNLTPPLLFQQPPSPHNKSLPPLKPLIKPSKSDDFYSEMGQSLNFLTNFLEIRDLVEVILL